jgi:hypothetical protein
LCVGFCLVQYCVHFHYCEWFLLVFCITLLCNRKRPEFGKPHAYRGPMCASGDCKWCGEPYFTPPPLEAEAEVTLQSSKLLYDWQSVSQSVCLGIAHPCGTCDQILLPVRMLLSEICGLLSVGHHLWLEDGSVICSVITQWSESRKTRNHTLLSHLRLPQPGRPGSRIYIPQEQGGPVISPGIGFPLHRLLRLAGLRWRYSNSSNLEDQVPIYISLRNRMVQSKVKVALEPTVSQSVYLGA